MTPLRKKMIDAMQVRGFSPRTHASYLWAVADLARYYHRSPDRISLQEIERYFLYLVQERHLADSSCRLYLHGLRFLYLQVLHWPDFDVPIPHPKRTHRIPQLLTRAEVARLTASWRMPAAGSSCPGSAKQSRHSAKQARPNRCPPSQTQCTRLPRWAAGPARSATKGTCG